MEKSAVSSVAKLGVLAPQHLLHEGLALAGQVRRQLRSSSRGTPSRPCRSCAAPRSRTARGTAAPARGALVRLASRRRVCVSISALRSSAPDRGRRSSSASGGPSVRKYDSAEARSNGVSVTVAPPPSSARARCGRRSSARSASPSAAGGPPPCRRRPCDALVVSDQRLGLGGGQIAPERLAGEVGHEVAHAGVRRGRPAPGRAPAWPDPPRPSLASCKPAPAAGRRAARSCPGGRRRC